jgi:hypothetical protein
MANKKIQAAKAEVQRLLDAGFIREVTYPEWMSNVVMIKKKMESGGCVRTSQTSTSAARRTTFLSQE